MKELYATLSRVSTETHRLPARQPGRQAAPQSDQQAGENERLGEVPGIPEPADRHVQPIIKIASA